MNPKRIALVTGGTRGIGEAVCVALKHADYEVVATYHGNDQAAESFSRQNRIRTYKWDVSDAQACHDGVARIAADVGPVDILVNNAGITRDGMFHKMAYDKWQDVIETNLTSCFNMTRAVIEGMRERSFGRIVNISSINGQKGQVGQANYCAAKAGLIGFSKALALETALRGITVNVVAPGYIETDMVRQVSPEVIQNIVAHIPVGRLGTTQDVARAVAFLVSEQAGFITGSTLSVNGGQYLA